MSLRTLTALCGTALLFGCEPPPVFAGADRRANAHVSRIEGEVVATTARRGNVALFLFDAARPPPPAGTGRPLTFTTVSREQLFGGAADGTTGPFTAPFAFSLVGPGRYIVRGFVDTSLDFIPWYGVTGEPNAGDVGGADVDPLTRAPRVVEIPDSLEPALEVGVSFSEAAVVPVDRPSFQVGAGDLSATVRPGAPTVLELNALPIVDGPIHQGQPAFLAQFIDANGDGMPDDANGDGVPEMWPRVVVRKIADGENVLLDENDLDKDGIVDATGADYEHVSPTLTVIPPDGQPDVVVLAAGIDPTELAPLLVDSMGRVKPTPTPVNKLRVVIRPQALDAVNPLAPVPLKAMPSGRYAITIIQSTGQTWRVPNELATGLSSRFGLPNVPSQTFVVQVP